MSFGCVAVVVCIINAVPGWKSHPRCCTCRHKATPFAINNSTSTSTSTINSHRNTRPALPPHPLPLPPHPVTSPSIAALPPLSPPRLPPTPHTACTPSLTHSSLLLFLRWPSPHPCPTPRTYPLSP